MVILPPPPLLPLLFEAVKGICRWFRRKKTPPPSYQEKAAQAEEIHHINRILEEERSECTRLCRECEDQIYRVAQEQFDSLLENFEAMKKLIGVEISPDFLRKQFQSYLKEIRGGLSRRINLRLATGDPECASILRERSEGVRADRFNRFRGQIILEGHRGFMEHLEELTDTAMSFLEGIMESKIQDKKTAMESVLQEINAISRELSAEEFAGKQQAYQEKHRILEGFLGAAW